MGGVMNNENSRGNAFPGYCYDYGDVLKQGREKSFDL